MKCKHVVVLDIVGLTRKYLDGTDLCPNIATLLNAGNACTLEVPFPAVTIPVQATLTTGKLPSDHGMIANGLFDRKSFEVNFWLQYASLVNGERIWDEIKRLKPELKTAVLFWQNTLYSDNDFVITPKPIHLEDGMIQWCYSKPVGYYEHLAKNLGQFDLSSYWGPLAGIKSSQWIIRAATKLFENEKPNLLMVYIPHLDYCCQRLGPENQLIEKELGKVDELLGEFLESIQKFEYTDETAIVVLSEYGFFQVSRAVIPNIILREHGFLKVREIEGKEYLDIEMSKAFAMVDHQVAHVYCKSDCVEDVKALLRESEGIDMVIDEELKHDLGINHPRSGELIAVSDPDSWFAYYWWTDLEKAPNFAFTVDIHRKPGYDPLELFFDPATKRVPQHVNLLKGSHGRVDLENENKPVFAIYGAPSQHFSLPTPMNATGVKKVILNLLGLDDGGIS